MPGDARKHRACPIAVKPRAPERECRAQTAAREACHQERMTREVQWRQPVADERLPLLDERIHQAAIRASVAVRKRLCGRRGRALEHRSEERRVGKEWRSRW